MPTAEIQQLNIEPSKVKIGENQVLFTNRVGITDGSSDEFYNLKYDASILDNRGGVIKTMCREDVKSQGNVETGLVHDPTKRAPLRCDPDGIQPDETYRRLNISSLTRTSVGQFQLSYRLDSKCGSNRMENHHTPPQGRARVGRMCKHG